MLRIWDFVGGPGQWPFSDFIFPSPEIEEALKEQLVGLCFVYVRVAFGMLFASALEPLNPKP